MCDGHGGGGLVASLYAAMLAEGDIEALVNKRLIGVVVVGQQSLLELALIHEDSLKMTKIKRGREIEKGVSKSLDRRRMNITTYAWLPCDLYFGRQLAYKACFEGNRRRWHVVSKEMLLSNADTGLVLLVLKIIPRKADHKIMNQSTSNDFKGRWRLKISYDQVLKNIYFSSTVLHKMFGQNKHPPSQL